MNTKKTSKLWRFLIGLASWVLGALIIFAMMLMLMAGTINKLLVFFILLFSLGLCAPFLQRKTNNLIKINISPAIYLVAAAALLVTGLIIASPTEEQAKQIEMQQAAEKKEKADKAAAKEKEKADKIAAKEREEAEKQAARDREKAEREAERAEKEAAKERERNTSDVVLITNCQLAIMPNLKNPKSMDVDMRQSKAFPITDGYGVNLYYYAQNSFGAMIINTAQCEFNSDGALLKVTAK